MGKKLGKREFIAALEATLRQQAATGTVSSKLAEQIIAVKGWRRKTKRAAVQPSPPPEAEAPQLVDLIAAAKEPVPPQPIASPPSPQPAPQPARAAAPPTAPPRGVEREALDLLCGIEEPAPSPAPQPQASPSPRPQAPLPQIYPVSHFDFADRPVIVTDDHPAPAENGGDGLYW